MASGLSRLVERNALERMASFFGGGGRAREPAGTVRVVDPSPLNWLYITYNTVEELVRVDTRGKIRPAAMRSYRWKDARTLLRSSGLLTARYGDNGPPTHDFGRHTDANCS